MLHYINRRYQPKRNDLVCLFYIEPNRSTIEVAAENVAKESSIGTWTELSTMRPSIAENLKPNIFYIDKKNNLIKIAYPMDLFEADNVPQILSSIAGNIFGMKAIKNLKLLDVQFPKSLLNAYKGPLLGIEGLRKYTGVSKRPLLGTIIKPKIGSSPKQHAQIAYNAWKGGCDIVKDDENLSSQKFNNFYKRIDETITLMDKAATKTGERKIYLPNITAETGEMLKRLDYVREHGGNYIMVDILTVGYAALQTVRKKSKLPIHAHRAMHGAITHSRKHGISFNVLGKFARLIGVDTIHVGTGFVGKMSETAEECQASAISMASKTTEENRKLHLLSQNWHNIKPAFSVASGGLHPGLVEKQIKTLGSDIVIQMGGGIHGHPDGTRKGATAARQAVNAVMKNIPLREYAKTHEELKKAIKLWGT